MDPQATQNGQPVSQQKPEPNGDTRLAEFNRPQCRLRNGLVFERPRSLKEFVDLIKGSGIHCTCREHNKLAYGPNGCRMPHCQFDRIKGKAPWTPPSKLTKGGKYEALHLAHYTALFISTTEEKMTVKQKDALSELRDVPWHLFKAETIDVKDVPVAGMLRLLELIGDLFFFSSLRVEFAWKDLSEENPGSDYHMIGSTERTDKGSLLITMDPCDHQKGRPPGARRDKRLKTLVHEAVHAYLRLYACTSCRRYDENVRNAGGHGRAFMEIATAVEQAFAGFGRPNQPVTGIDSWAANWEKFKFLPSVHDIQKWGWYKVPRPSDPSDDEGPPRKYHIVES